MSVAAIGTTRRLELIAYLDQRDNRVWRGQAGLVVDELKKKADAMGMRNRKVTYEPWRSVCFPSVIGVVTIRGDVEFSG